MSEPADPKDVIDTLYEKAEVNLPDTLRTVKEIQRLQRQLAEVGTFSDASAPLRLPYSSMAPLTPQCWKL